MSPAVTVWPQPDGEPVSCRDKIEVLNDNYDELQHVMQDAFEDALLMGVDEVFMRGLVARLAADLKAPPPMTRSSLLLLAVLIAAQARAETVDPPSISPPDTWLPRRSGTVRVLNKIDSTLRSLTLHTGETAHLQSLSITLVACAVRPPDLPADAAAHLTVSDSRPDAPGFDGWILQNEPAANMLEHPVYDVQLASCS